MKRKGRARLIPALLFLFLGALAAATAWQYHRRDLPPVEALREARVYLNLVQQAAPEEEAEPLIASAEENLKRAQVSLDAQYRRLSLFRDFTVTRYHIARARDLGGEALAAARQARAEAVLECQRRLLTLRRSLSTSRSLLARLSLKDGALVKLTSAEARLAVADSRLSDHDAREVREILNRAEEEIAEASIQLQGTLSRFLARRELWDSWIRETIADSERGNRTALIVDKLNHECYVLQGGRVVDTYTVDLGGMWMDQKIREGDRATPEGRYKVASLKKESRYYRAALLDYPNETDRSRFVRAKREGRLARSARIGGLIEIHGEGGRGIDWTAGCISLSNHDLDRLFRHMRVGTPVTIVGLWQEPSWLRRAGAQADPIGLN